MFATPKYRIATASLVLSSSLSLLTALSGMQRLTSLSILGTE
jgi:hypothetical protein